MSSPTWLERHKPLYQQLGERLLPRRARCTTEIDAGELAKSITPLVVDSVVGEYMPGSGKTAQAALREVIDHLTDEQALLVLVSLTSSVETSMTQDVMRQGLRAFTREMVLRAAQALVDARAMWREDSIAREEGR